MVVPGVEDNPSLGIRRGKFNLSGKDLRDVIFEPVVCEVLTLLRKQICETKTSIKGILLVGGFGQSGYLRDRVRMAHSDIEVLQPPNG